MRELHYEWFFETLANPLRMRILLILLQRPRSVNELVGEVGEEQSKVSHALHVLRLCKLVRAQARGRRREYRSNEKVLVPLLRIVDAHVCSTCAGGCEQAVRKKNRREKKALA